MHLARLSNPVKHYDWGSPRSIPNLLGVSNPDGTPWAELWMGAHQSSPSKTEAGERLDALIASDRGAWLGPGVERAFGSLPFLFKLLAAATPLSLQVHPSLTQARTGFDREEGAGLALDNPKRNYKDRNHKPEVLCALTPFDALSGFRSPQAIAKNLELLGVDELLSCIPRLSADDEVQALRTFFLGLFEIDPAAKMRILKALPTRLSYLSHSKADMGEWALIRKLLDCYPSDIGVLAPLYLNLIHLQPGDALYVSAGILHSYVEGFAVELMANSDNVIRGGLTPKHVDLGELGRILRFETAHPAVLKAEEIRPGLCRYDTPSREFTLFCADLAGVPVSLVSGHCQIVVVIEGSVDLSLGNGERLHLERGESACVSASAENPVLSGIGRAFVATDGILGTGEY